MDYQNSRLSNRLLLNPEVAEKLYSAISQIDAAKNSWKFVGRLQPTTIERLTHSVIVTSTGASNRIEGNSLSDEEVENLYRNLRIKKFKTRDEQEVAGYLEVLQFIFENYEEMRVKEFTILQLHRDMLSYSEKDERHRGVYKSGSNRVEARDGKGNLVGIIFDPTPPHLTPKEMQELCGWLEWAENSSFKHPLILIANFIFEYLAIHPFQDGNGRTSRLLTNLMLLRNGYGFASVVSHEKLIENKKADYYLSLNKAQLSWKSENEDISSWLLFIFGVFQKQAEKAMELLQGEAVEDLLSEKQLLLWKWACSLPEKQFSRSMAMGALGFPPRTIESIIKKLNTLHKLEKIGEGRSTRYRVIE